MLCLNSVFRAACPTFRQETTINNCKAQWFLLTQNLPLVSVTILIFFFFLLYVSRVDGANLSKQSNDANSA